MKKSSELVIFRVWNFMYEDILCWQNFIHESSCMKKCLKPGIFHVWNSTHENVKSVINGPSLISPLRPNDAPYIPLIAYQYSSPHAYHIYWLRGLVKQGDNALGSVCPSVCPSVRPSVRLFALSRLNRLTCDLHLLHGGRPWPWLGWLCRSRS